MSEIVAERKAAIHLLRSGHSVQEVAQELKRHPNWVRKWHQRYRAEGWSGLQDRSRAPRKHGRKLKDKVWRAICQARSELEAKAATGEGLRYIGPIAVRTRLRKKKIKPLPSKSTIERVLREQKMTRPYQKRSEEKIAYPHLRPAEPLQLCQVDIVPHYLQGGERVACFNAIDVVSRYPTGQAFRQRRAKDAARFLIHTWQTIGIPRYTQVDNEGCFSGGFTHPYVLGQVLRLALAVGTELVFSPVYHPQSNGYVERFHQDYDQHVWETTYLRNRQQVQDKADKFFQAYRHSQHHSALNDLSPHRCHQQVSARKLSPDFVLPEGKIPLVEGRVHFIRRVETDGTVRVLNVNWTVPQSYENQSVWVTLEFKQSGATLHIYNAAPDITQRKRLAAYLFPLDETVLPKPVEIDDILETSDHNQIQTSVGDQTDGPTSKNPGLLLVALITQTARLASRVLHTMY
jgi:transposase InsO family protein